MSGGGSAWLERPPTFTTSTLRHESGVDVGWTLARWGGRWGGHSRAWGGRWWTFPPCNSAAMTTVTDNDSARVGPGREWAGYGLHFTTCHRTGTAAVRAVDPVSRAATYTAVRPATVEGGRSARQLPEGETMRRLPAILALGLALLGTACGGSASPPAPTARPSAAPSPATFAMHGTVDGVACDVSAGRPQVVQVRDETNKLIGQGMTSANESDTPCSIFQTFTVSGLPRATFYSVKIGRRPGAVTYSFARLQHSGWRVKLKYGF
jgi:hypothetical protein